MSGTSTIDAIQKISTSRDTALRALSDSITAIEEKMKRVTQQCKDRLEARRDQVIARRMAIRAAAIEDILSLPGVINAAGALNSLSNRMKEIAEELPNSTEVLTKTDTVLALGQQFSTLISGAQ